MASGHHSSNLSQKSGHALWLDSQDQEVAGSDYFAVALDGAEPRLSLESLACLWQRVAGDNTLCGHQPGGQPASSKGCGHSAGPEKTNARKSVAGHRFSLWGLMAGTS